MNKILVSGLINIETTLQVEGFPVEYNPVCFPFFGIQSSVSGVGYNVAKALTVLGDQVDLLSLVGADDAAGLVYQALERDAVSPRNVLPSLTNTPQSVILYDKQGRRAIYTDLKDIQERDYPAERFGQILEDCSMAVLCNINFSRPYLQRVRRAGKLLATDVHAVADVEDPYNRDFMAAADILFLSDENLPCSPEEWVRRLWQQYEAGLVVVGLGEKGALLGVRSDGFLERIPTMQTRPVKNTIGAGDALFSGFVHFYQQSGDPYRAIRKAVAFASYKVGAVGAAEGFLDEAALEALIS